MKLLEGKWIGLLLYGKIAVCSLHSWGIVTCVSHHWVELRAVSRILSGIR